MKLDLYVGTTSATYDGFDRFGRTIDQRWVDYSIGTVDVDRIKYGHDYGENRGDSHPSSDQEKHFRQPFAVSGAARKVKL